jgi:glycosyltransferase involved in cell wall biosynthesis
MNISQESRHNELNIRQTGRVVAAMRRSQLRRYREAAACCVASDWAAGSVVTDYGIDASRVHVVGFGRNCEPRPVPRDRSDPRFLFVGLDWQRKNGDAVVRAFARLRDELPRARLDLVGGHPRVEVDGVVGHGPLGVDEPAARAGLEALFEQATCFVMPSRFEAFGMVYVEAGAAAVPSIGTTRGGAATAIAGGGVLVDPEDEGALVDAMRSLADPATADGLGRAALENASRYTWKGVAERILEAAGPTS